MNIKVLFNEDRGVYRIAYKTRWYRGWRFAQRIIVSQSISPVSGAKYVENFHEIAEFEAIGEAQEFIELHVAPQSEWFNPNDESWTTEAEVAIPEKKRYTTPKIPADE
jgi:hypothetical protein